MAEKTRQTKMLKQDDLVQDLARVFGENVFVLRTYDNLSQEKLASMADVSRSHVSDIENGIIDARFSDVVAFARALDRSLDVLMTPGGALRALGNSHSKL